MTQYCECGHPIESHYDPGGCAIYIKIPGTERRKLCDCTEYRIRELSELRAENERLRAELAALRHPPTILDKDERKELEQRLYEAQMLEGTEMEY